MSEGIGVALIQLVGTIIATIGSLGAAVFAILAARRAKHARDDTRTIRAEVQNDHTTNLRDDLDGKEQKADERHVEHTRKLDQIIDTLDEHTDRLDRLEGSDEHQDERIDRIERTWPRSRFAPPARHRKEETP